MPVPWYAQRSAILIDHLRKVIGRALGCAPADVDPDRSFDDLGVDSLMAVESKLALEEDLGVEIPIAFFLKSGSFEQFARDYVSAFKGG